MTLEDPKPKLLIRFTTRKANSFERVKKGQTNNPLGSRKDTDGIRTSWKNPRETKRQER